MSFGDMKILGWNQDEWSVIFGAMDKSEKHTIDLNMALKIKRERNLLRIYGSPLTVLHGVDQKRDYESVAELYSIPNLT